MGSLQIIQGIFVASLIASGDCEVIVISCLLSLACNQHGLHSLGLDIVYGFNKSGYLSQE